MFLNYNATTDTFSINSYRLEDALSCFDIGDYAEDYQNGYSVSVYIHDLQLTIDALCDGHYWQGSDITQDTLEAIYNFLMDYVQQNEV